MLCGHPQEEKGWEGVAGRGRGGKDRVKLADPGSPAKVAWGLTTLSAPCRASAGHGEEAHQVSCRLLEQKLVAAGGAAVGGVLLGLTQGTRNH